MKRMIVFFTVALLWNSVPCLASDSSDTQVKFDVVQGTRHDHLRWKVEPKHEAKDAMAKYNLRHIKVHLSGLRAQLSTEHYVGLVNVIYGNVLGGSYRATAYGKDNGTNEQSHVRAKIRGEFTFDTSAQFGRKFSLPFKSTFTPSLGYGYSIQHYKMRHGSISFREDQPKYPFAPKISGIRKKIHDLSMSLRTRWQAPFIDLRFSQQILPNFGIDVGYTFFYPIHYVGKRYENHDRMRFKDKAKDGKSMGHHGDLLLHWAWTKNVEIGLGGAFSESIARGGSSKSHLFGCDRDRLKKVKRTTRDYFLTLSYMF